MRPPARSAAPALLVLLAACGPGGHGGDDDETTPPEASATPSASPDPTAPTPTPGPCATDCQILHRLDAGDRAGTFGWAVADLGDVDGDGARDVIVGAPFNGAGGANAGAVLVYSGATGARLLEVLGETRHFLGWAIADAGDVDGDGTPDVIAGGPDASEMTAGRAVVFSGATGDVLWTFTGEAAADYFGYAVASAGDIDEDGHADLLVGAPAHDTEGGANAGRIYYYSGADGALLRTVDGADAGGFLGSGTATVGDLDGDGVAEAIVGAPGSGAALVLAGADGTTLHRLVADPGAQAFGDFFVADAGDVDADGSPDLYVGDYGHGGGDGRAYVFDGATGARLYTWEGAPAEGLGCGRGAGDVDGDGHADLATGAYTSSEGAEQAGKVYVRSGATGDTLVEIVSTRAGEQLGFDAVGLGDVSGDGDADLLVAAPPGERVYILTTAMP